MTIHVLTDDVASQIAAGEVIERPASVVKEMIENSIDAGSTRISVKADEAGKKLIEISDNGSGIKADELELAVKRHATSKLQTADDLFHIHTLGFRGEALAAAGSVSHMTITTRCADEEAGSMIVVDAGIPGRVKPAASPVGTVIQLEDLFYNVPARLKFLKSDPTEKGLIESLIGCYALAYPAIRWQCTLDQRAGIRTTGNGDRREIMSAIYGVETAKQFLEIDLQEEDIHVSGFISPVALTRSNRKEMIYFVNGRRIQDTALNGAVQAAYQSLIMVGRFPLVSLFIEIPPEEVDVNVHPAKAEVRFRNPEKIRGAVHRAVRRGLIAQSPVPELNTPLSSLTWPDRKAAASGGGGPSFQNIWQNPLIGSIPQQPAMSFNPNSAAPDAGRPLEFIPPEPSEPQENQTADIPAAAGESAAAVPDVSAAPEAGTDVFSASSGFPILRWIGQIGSTYVLAEGPDGLYLIDQHAAHERILYEKMLALAGTEHAGQILLDPPVLQLQTGQAGLLEESLPVMESLGFKIESFGPNSFRILAVPAVFTNRDPISIVRSAVENIEDDEKPLDRDIKARVAAHVCKSMAVKAGQTLSPEEQRALIRDLEACQSPRTCPHGRPTMIHLSIDLLARQFGRKGAI